jgi:hypothetical protein
MTVPQASLPVHASAGAAAAVTSTRHGLGPVLHDQLILAARARRRRRRETASLATRSRMLVGLQRGR